jgi:hypothetical protein
MNIYPQFILGSKWNYSFSIGNQRIIVNAIKTYHHIWHIILGFVPAILNVWFSAGIALGVNGYQMFWYSKVNPEGVLQDIIDTAFYFVGIGLYLLIRGLV